MSVSTADEDVPAVEIGSPDMAEAASAVQAILARFGIKRVVVVDDRSRTANWVLIGSRLTGELRQEIADDLGLALTVLTEDWPFAVEQLDDEQRGALVAAFEGAAIEGGLDPATTEIDVVDDEAIYSNLGMIVGESAEIVQIDPQAWSGERESLLNQAKALPTLFLVDQDMGAVRGSRLIHEVLTGPTDGCRFCLFTATVQPQDEYAQWEQIALDEDLAVEAVGLVSKHHLVEGTALGFARMLKMSLSYAEVVSFREGIVTRYLAAAESAASAIRNIKVPVLAQIVFESSTVEGVWEVETLTRLLRSVFEDELDRSLRDPDLVDTTALVRSAAIIGTGPDPSLMAEASKLQALERYHHSDFNMLHEEIANGDVFRVDTANGPCLLVLAAQPCDVSLRSSGGRSGDQSHQVMLQIVETDEPPASSVELPYFRAEGGSFVRLVRPRYVPTILLELCSFNDDGVARVPPAATDGGPVFATDGAKKRYLDVSKKLIAALERVSKWATANLPDGVVARQFPHADRPLILPTVVLEDGARSLEYPVQRVGRLRAPLAEAVLTAYGLASSRTAEAHDLALISSAVLE